MKKLAVSLILLSIIFIATIITLLTTLGIETKKFNNLISEKAYKLRNINLELNSIRFKLDIKELSLFLETQDPKLIYREVYLPVQNIKIYIDFLSILKTRPIIEKTNLVFYELDITQLNKLSSIIKPSNFKSLLNNKIKQGKLISEIEIYFNEEGIFKDFIAKGKVRELRADLFSGLSLSKTNFNFFADNSDILIKKVFGNIEDIKINDGDIKLNLDNGIKLYSNFNTQINLNNEKITKYYKFFNKNRFVKNIENFKANFDNSFSINLDKTYKIKNYNFKILGTIEKSKLKILPPFNNDFVNKEINKIYLSDFKINTVFGPKNINFNGDGNYSFNNSDYLKVNLINNINNDQLNLKLDFDYKNNFELNFINYKKSKNSISNIYLELDKKDQNYNIKKLKYKEKNNIIEIDELRLKDYKLSSFKKIQVDTKNNNFFIEKDKKISVKGNKFDATNLIKYLKTTNNDNSLKNLTGNIEIDFKNIKAPLSEKIENFRLIGRVEKGKFIKISSKGNFGGNNFLDISLKKDKKTKKKYLEIYSDLTRPLLTEYSFFKGLSGGKLIYNSIIDGSKSTSKLKIENFKVINAPGVIKLLSLADLGGLADLAEGEGLSFDVLEIEMEKNQKFLKLNEILALGPSMSVLMEGYQDENELTSLRGTLVPAKTLNKMISKIPVIGNIVIPKEVGEGLFGISFKMKGPKGKIKTTINPIKTLTPRFIQKILERNKAK